jgi:hypothetical protein
MIPLLKGLSRIILVLMKKLNYSIKANSYKKKGILEMNFSPNNVQLPNNQQFGQSFDVKNIFRPYPLITDRNLHPLTECVNHLVQEVMLPCPSLHILSRKVPPMAIYLLTEHLNF